MPRRDPAKRKAVESEPTALDVELRFPDGTISQYVNHITVQTRETEVVVNFAHVPSFAIDQKTGKAPAYLLGSYLLPRHGAADFVRLLGQALGLRVTPAEETE